MNPAFQVVPPSLDTLPRATDRNFKQLTDLMRSWDRSFGPVGDLVVNGNASVGGNLTVAGSSTFTGPATFTGAATFNGATFNQLTLHKGGVDISGSPTGYTGGELKFSNTANNAEQGISTWATGTPTMEFDHRATNNTGEWLWRNGTSATQRRMYLTGSGILNVGTSIPGANHASNRVDATAQAYGRGFAYAADGAPYRSGVSAGLSIAVSRSDPAFEISQDGSGMIWNFFSGGGYRFYGQGEVSALLFNDLYFGSLGGSRGGSRLHLATGDQNVVYAQAESIGADCNIFFMAKGAGIHRFYVDDYVFDIRGRSTCGILDTAMWLYWKDGPGTEHFTKVTVSPTTNGGLLLPGSHMLVVIP